VEDGVSRRDSGFQADGRPKYQSQIDHERFVGIDFGCKRNHDPVIMGSWYMYTFDGADRTPFTKADSSGRLPEDLTTPEGHPGKALLICSACTTNHQLSAQRLKAALDAIWRPNLRRVITYWL
jgi:hypothetical protein